MRRDHCWEKITCKQCGAINEFPRSAKREFCSDACSKRFRSGSNHPRWVSARVAQCLQCDKDFSRYVVRPAGRAKNRPNYSERKFCSSECRRLYRRLNPYPRNAKIGETSKWKDGYQYIKVSGRGWVPKHRHIMEQLVSRKLARQEDVHHRNGNKRDNRPENLQLLSKSEHRKLHRRAERLGLILISLDGWEDLFERLEREDAHRAAAADSESGTS